MNDQFQSVEELKTYARAVIERNDRGGYTVPTHGLYPFQWNWDSCLTAIGMAHYDETRAWREIETLFEHQWPDGMVPHIIFHELDEGYFPGPDRWQTNRPTPTSGITQPAVAGFAVAEIVARSSDKDHALAKAKTLLPAIDRWHQWFYDHRDPTKEGLVAVIHPWETGRDNSVDWDRAFERVPSDNVAPYTRRDLDHADASDRPTKEQYDRYLWLVDNFRSHDWNNMVLHQHSPFQVVDPGFNAILIRSSSAVADLAIESGDDTIAVRNHKFADRGRQALESLWSEDHGQHVCRDRVQGELIDSASVGGILSVFALLESDRVAALAKRVEQLANACRYIVPSHDPTSTHFDARRYWRGPAWAIVNYMIADGFRKSGHAQLADRIDASTIDLIMAGGLAEYFDPLTGEPCGGRDFTWTAAMAIELLGD